MASLKSQLANSNHLMRNIESKYEALKDKLYI